MPWAPERGDVVWITKNPSVGHEQSGRRPALVISPGSYNSKVGLAILCPITGQVKGYPFEVAVPDGLPVQGVILSDQAKSLDWRSRGAEFLCKVSLGSVTEVLQKLERLVTP
ncbi:MAG: type II toxin-antitoxin system PemK/MazF family toxin [Coriobacteriia bacterium]|nr:type II toxin-antitoxin system PemK/MazF family toxin [Coriobacteriia bacterium]MDO9107878.1 type II toxin-antitoxin system PemK/MazF family toxin [Coriobacteriia bacterium]